MSNGTRGIRVATGAFACAAWFGAALLTSDGAVAQTPPTCTSVAQSTPGANQSSSIDHGAAGFVCVANVGGVDKLIAGAFFADSGRSGYMLIMNANGALMRSVCWGVNSTIASCPTIKQ